MQRLVPNVISAVVIMLCDLIMTMVCSPFVQYLADYLTEILPHFENIAKFIEVAFNWHPWLIFAAVVLWLVFSAISKQYDSDEFGVIR